MEKERREPRWEEEDPGGRGLSGKRQRGKKSNVLWKERGRQCGGIKELRRKRRELNRDGRVRENGCVDTDEGNRLG